MSNQPQTDQKTLTFQPDNFPDFQAFVEHLFWRDQYVIDDGQYIYDTATDTLYQQDKPFFMTVNDRFTHGKLFQCIEVTDPDIKAEVVATWTD